MNTIKWARPGNRTQIASRLKDHTIENVKAIARVRGMKIQDVLEIAISGYCKAWCRRTGLPYVTTGFIEKRNTSGES